MERMDTLVGITEHTKTRKAQFPEVARLPSVGRGFMPNFEVIAELRPDVILCMENKPRPGTGTAVGTFRDRRTEA